MVLVQQTLHDTESIKLLDDEVQLHIIDGAKSWSWATVHKKIHRIYGIQKILIYITRKSSYD